MRDPLRSADHEVHIAQPTLMRLPQLVFCKVRAEPSHEGKLVAVFCSSLRHMAPRYHDTVRFKVAAVAAAPRVANTAS